MTDLSAHTSVARHPPIRTLLFDSLRVHAHMARLLLQAGSCDKRSMTAMLKNGAPVPLEHGFTTDGTTFVVITHNGTERRVPASAISAIEDKHDWGY